MDGAVYVMLSGALTFGVPLVLAVHELIALKRRDGGGWEGDGPRPVAPKPLPYDWEKPLPECLLPRVPEAGTSRPRTLQDA